jgi:hypothetical protein
VCPLCDEAVEDDWHLIVNCPISVEARRAAGLEDIVTHHLLHTGSAAELIFKICRLADRDLAGRFATLAWSLWQNRNNKVWQDDHENGRRLGVMAFQHWMDWKQVQQTRSYVAGTENQQHHEATWQKPPVGWLKCNTDAGFHNGANKTSAGWILRNYMGNFVLAGTVWYQGKWSIIEGEAMAILEAMRVMEQNGITHVIFESDSKNVVEAIHSLRTGISEFSSIICNIRNVLAFNPNFVVKVIKRQAHGCS